MSDIFDKDDFVNPHDENAIDADDAKGGNPIYTYPQGYNPLHISPVKGSNTTMENITQNATEETLLDLDDVEGMDFDSIEDAPGFVTPPDGLYMLTLTKACVEAYKTKATADKPSENRKRFAHYYAIAKVLELDDSTEQAPKEGDKFSERFMHNAEGIKYWKTKAKAILGDIGKVSVANVLAELSSGNYTFKAKIQNKKSKGKSDNKEYTNTQVRVLKVEKDPSLEGGAVTTDESVI
jgi:hypothetical protein